MAILLALDNSLPILNMSRKSLQDDWKLLIQFDTDDDIGVIGESLLLDPRE